MKILLIDNFQNINKDEYLKYSAGLLILGTILKDKGHDVEIINFEYLFVEKFLHYNYTPMENINVMADYIIDKKPAIVGFTTMCNSFHNSLLIAKFLKEKNNNIKIIMGGPQASILPEKILSAFSWIDLVCSGEGENKIIPLVEGLVTNNLTCVPGITYRKNSSILTNPEIDNIINLDSLPQLDYTLIPYFQKCPVVLLEAGRGCPYNCLYCSTSDYWKRKFRMKSIEKISREISCMRNLRGNNQFEIAFIHDNFTVDKKYVEHFCGNIHNITWTCSSRPDNLDEEIIKKMSMAGCTVIYMGIESASEKIQTYIRKNLKLDRLDYIIESCINNGITPNLSFIYGFPCERDEDLDLTLNQIYSLLKKGIPNCQIHSLCVLNGSRLYEEVKDKLIFRGYYSDMSASTNIEFIRPLIEEHKDIFSHFYIIEDSSADKYHLLGKFIFYIMIYLYKYFPETIDGIIEIYNNSLLAFYKDFLANNEDNFSDFFNAGSDMGDFVEIMEILSAVTFSMDIYIKTKSSKDERFINIIDIFDKENFDFMIKAAEI